MLMCLITQPKGSEAQKGREGRFGKDNPFFGRKHSAESMKRKSETTRANGKLKGENNPNYGKKYTLERRQQISLARKGRKLTEEHKKKISLGGKGIPKSEEWKAKVSGKNNGWYGKGHLMSGNNSPSAKKCIHIKTGIKYNCLKVAYKELGISYNTQLAYMKPHHVRHKNRKFNYL